MYHDNYAPHALQGYTTIIWTSLHWREHALWEEGLLGISSPLTSHLHQWQQALAGHPDSKFATYMLNGIEHGFRVGFAHGSPLSPAGRNMHSAALHPSVVDSYISTESREGRMLGPFPLGRIEGLQINRMGVVPKGHTPGRWRLSYPEGNSVNDGSRRFEEQLNHSELEYKYPTHLFCVCVDVFCILMFFCILHSGGIYNNNQPSYCRVWLCRYQGCEKSITVLLLKVGALRL